MTDRATEQERQMQKDYEYARNVENVARAAVYLLGLAEVEGDVVKIPLEHWNNYKAVIETTLLKKPA
jgi:hypothetical protein